MPMPPDHARAVIDAFQQVDRNPPCDAAVTDDGSEVGFEWRVPDGRMLFVDICADGSVVAAWSPLTKPASAP